MEKQMLALAKKEQFEQSKTLRDQMRALIEAIHSGYEPFQFDSSDMLTYAPKEQVDMLTRVLIPWFPALCTINRIECYDISNVGGKKAVGSMVVNTRGLMDSSEYRRFKINRKEISNDPAMMEEVLTRRFNHTDWPYPELIVVDGGKTQIQAAYTSLARHKLVIPIIGITKKQEEILVGQAGSFHTILLPLNNPALLFLMRLRDESHRFAITYHRHLRGKIFAAL
jgi:excinuclease ABC subunit C